MIYKGEKRFKSLSKVGVDLIIHLELEDKSGFNFYVCIIISYYQCLQGFQLQKEISLGEGAIVLQIQALLQRAIFQNKCTPVVLNLNVCHGRKKNRSVYDAERARDVNIFLNKEEVLPSPWAKANDYVLPLRCLPRQLWLGYPWDGNPTVLPTGTSVCHPLVLHSNIPLTR